MRRTDLKHSLRKNEQAITSFDIASHLGGYTLRTALDTLKTDNAIGAYGEVRLGIELA